MTASTGYGRSGWRTIEPVGTVAVSATTTVRRGSIVCRLVSLLAPNWSKAIITSTAPAVAMFDAQGVSSDRRTSLTTGPAF